MSTRATQKQLQHLIGGQPNVPVRQKGAKTKPTGKKGSKVSSNPAHKTSKSAQKRKSSQKKELQKTGQGKVMQPHKFYDVAVCLWFECHKRKLVSR